jgi:hypothetical protein
MKFIYGVMLLFWIILKCLLNLHLLKMTQPQQAPCRREQAVPLVIRMVPELLQSPMTSLRKSKRREQSVDKHSLQRAESVKTKKNLQCIYCCKSFLPFMDSHIASNISELVILLGNGMHTVVCKLKNMEMDRLLVVQKKMMLLISLKIWMTCLMTIVVLVLIIRL